MFWSLTFVCIAEGTSEGSTHSDVSVLQVLEQQILDWDRLPVNLETLALVPGDGAGQNQKLGEQEHVQLLVGIKWNKLTRKLRRETLTLRHACAFCSPCRSCSVAPRDTAGSYTARCEGLSACRPDTPACRCSTGTQTLPSSCWYQTKQPGWWWSEHTRIWVNHQPRFKIRILLLVLKSSPGLTAFSRLAASGCSGGVCLSISLSSSGYLTRRDRGMSRKLHRSSFLLKGDSRQRCRKSCTRGSCFFWSSSVLAASWLLQYSL